ncbi:MAG: guanylate kinase [Dehalococcoidales bacterium]|jgi:guanylate kinase
MTNHNPFIRDSNPLLIVLSGPSGAGKDAVLSHIKNSDYPFTCITTVTTRPKRINEKDDLDYHFVNHAEFQSMVSHQQFLEHASVYGNWYGVPRKPVKAALEQGQDVIIKVDIQGAATIRKIVPEAVLIFLTPPTTGELASRLEQRRTESKNDLELRLKTTAQEMAELPRFDYLVFNHKDRIEQAVADIKAIVSAEKCRTKPRQVTI